MKRIFLKTVLILLLLVTSFTIEVFSQPPPPPPGGGHGGSTNKVPKDVPIGGGIEILIGLAAVYGGLRLRRELKEMKSEVEA